MIDTNPIGRGKITGLYDNGAPTIKEALFLIVFVGIPFALLFAFIFS